MFYFEPNEDGIGREEVGENGFILSGWICCRLERERLVTRKLIKRLEDIKLRYIICWRLPMKMKMGDVCIKKRESLRGKFTGQKVEYVVETLDFEVDWCNGAARIFKNLSNKWIPMLNQGKLLKVFNKNQADEYAAGKQGERAFIICESIWCSDLLSRDLRLQ